MKSFLKLVKKIIKHYRREFALQKWIQENRNIETFIVVGGFGDIVWFMSFWIQYKKKEHLETYKILTETKYVDMFHLYGESNLQIDAVEVIPAILSKTAHKKTNKFKNIHVMYFPHYFGKRAVKVIEQYRVAAGISMDDYFRFGCFDLSYETDEPITLPQLAKTNYTIHTKKNILLIPYTKSRINIPLNIWGSIANLLRDNGYTVYTNVGTEKEKAIEGSIPIIVKVAELPAILKKYDFISLCGRCGLADWLFANDCKQIILHSCLVNPKTRNEWLCSGIERKDSFKMMKLKLRLNEKSVDDLYLYIDNLSSDYLQKILNSVEKLAN
ncbi:MAG: hypothetical protein IK024_12950 [Treponema sp.]|nr:hypothetical protein [Treponema sp.]